MICWRNIWAFNFGASGVDWTAGDATGEFQTTLSDFNVWAFNYGATAGSTGGTPVPISAVNTPEPSSLLLLALGTLGLVGYGWRRRKRGCESRL